MKTTAKLLLALIPLIILQSCNKEELPETEVFGNVFNITMKNSQEYSYTFGISGDEEGATIIAPASHSKTCKIIRNEETLWKPVFRYQPKENFTGPDVARIETCTGSDGSVNCAQRDTLIFTFNIIK